MDTHTGYQKLLAGESSGRICNNPDCSIVEEIVEGYTPVWPSNIRPMRLLTKGAETPWIPFECCPNCGKEMEEIGVYAITGEDLKKLILCPDCKGTGKYPNAYSKDGPCPSCGGTGN